MSIKLNRPSSPREAAARRTDPDTSHAAAAAVDAKQLELRVLRSLMDDGPGTTEAIGTRLGIPRDSVSPRMKSLERKRLVERSGRTKNLSGVSAIVWRPIL